MENLLPFAFLCLTSLFTLTNPLGIMPVFLSMTKDIDNAQRARIVKKATFIAFISLLCFTFGGQVLFSLFGISANGFRIAAGFIIFKIGFDMLQAKYTNTKFSKEEAQGYADDITITPLAIPLLCGPGNIASSIMLMENASTWAMKFTLVVSIMVIYVLAYFILRGSTRLIQIIGETGNKVMMRLMGLILMVIAVECFVNGLKPVLVDIIKLGVA